MGQDEVVVSWSSLGHEETNKRAREGLTEATVAAAAQGVSSRR